MEKLQEARKRLREERKKVILEKGEVMPLYDDFETSSPNDYIEDAQRIYEDEDIKGYVDERYDVDWYKIKFAQDGNANFYLEPNASELDVDLYICDENENIYGSSNNAAGIHDLVTIPVKAGQYYYISVEHAGRNGVNKTYLLRCKNYPGEIINDTFEKALPVSEGEVVEEFVDDTVERFYKVKFTANQVGVMLARPSSDNRGFRMHLYDKNKEVVAREDYSTPGKYKVLKAPVTDIDTYYVRIFGLASQMGGNPKQYFEFEYKTESADVESAGSAFNTAMLIREFEVARATAKENRDDYYAFVPSENMRAQFILTTSDKEVRQKLYLYDEDRNEIGYDSTVTGGHQAFIEKDLLPGKGYFLKVLTQYADYSDVQKYCLEFNILGIGGGGGNKPSYTITDAIKDLKLVERAATEHLGSSATNKKVNRDVLVYLARKYDYKGIEWQIVMDSFTKGFDTYIENNSTYRNAVDRLQKEARYILDAKKNQIDFGHMIATIVGYYCPSVTGLLLPPSYFGWAGDLASGTGHLYDRLAEDSSIPKTYEGAKSVAMLSTDWECSLDDMIGDIDGELIGKRLKASNTLLSAQIESHYTTDYKYRYMDFVSSNGGESAMENEIINIMCGEPVAVELGLRYFANKASKHGGLTIPDFYFKAMGWRFSKFVIHMKNATS